MTRRGRLATGLLLLAGLMVLVGTAAVGTYDLLEALVSPAPVVRAVLVGVMAVVSVALLRASIDRFRAAGAGRGPIAEADPLLMLRGIRLAFLALAAVAAGIGWLVGHPLPLVVAAVIAAVDVAETSLLLLVTGARGGDDSPEPADGGS
jgi:hypothetical protein